MRAVVFLGLIFIGSSLRDAPMGDDTITALAFIFLVATVMDIIEFIDKLTKK